MQGRSAAAIELTAVLNPDALKPKLLRNSQINLDNAAVSTGDCDIPTTLAGSTVPGGVHRPSQGRHLPRDVHCHMDYLPYTALRLVPWSQEELIDQTKAGTCRVTSSPTWTTRRPQPSSVPNLRLCSHCGAQVKDLWPSAWLTSCAQRGELALQLWRPPRGQTMMCSTSSSTSSPSRSSTPAWSTAPSGLPGVLPRRERPPDVLLDPKGRHVLQPR